MIPRAHITAWRAVSPWPFDEQVEQDLIICRALCDIFADKELAPALAFRGGTALHKLYLSPPGRYSEDIDLVQVQAGPAGPIFDGIRRVLGEWLGSPATERTADSVKLQYRFETTSLPVRTMRLKVEINTREHFATEGFKTVPMSVKNPWYEAEADILTYSPEELLATKMRALYQRRKGRDLYDIWLALTELRPDESVIIKSLLEYLSAGGLKISRREFEANLAAKMIDDDFRGDVLPLLRGDQAYDFETAFTLVLESLVSRL